jgi:phosphate:Na+ symporter
LSATLTLVDLAGSIALLLWGVRMIRTGLQRALGPNLRGFLSGGLSNRISAFLAGLGVTALLQSSTATGLMVTSFAARGLVALVPALAVMLGANVGTTIIVQALSFDVSRVAPLLILLGTLAYSRAGARGRDLGQAVIGLGLVLLALGHLLVIVKPYEDAPSLRLLLGMITTTPIVALLLSAGLTWAAHSSVATVLVVMSFAAKGVVPSHAAFALVLGANLGTAINPLIEGAHGNDPAAKRVPLGNLLNRALGCMVALALLSYVGPWLMKIESDPARALADFHTAFNLALALAFLPLLGPYARCLQWLLPSKENLADQSRPLYLDATARDMPPIALAGATREALRMTDVLESMLLGTLEALDGTDQDQVESTRQIDDTLDRLNGAIKDYLMTLIPEKLSEADTKRLSGILTFATNLEHAGDVLDRSVMSLTAKRMQRGLTFSAEGRAEIRAMLERLIANLRSAAAVFVSQDGRAARQLAEEKEAFRQIEAQAMEAHFERLRSGRVETAETSSLHIDLVSELKAINSYLVAAAAYPVLQGKGHLLPSRLKRVK